MRNLMLVRYSIADFRRESRKLVTLCDFVETKVVFLFEITYVIYKKLHLPAFIASYIPSWVKRCLGLDFKVLNDLRYPCDVKNDKFQMNFFLATFHLDSFA